MITIREDFDSIQSFINIIENRPVNDVMKKSELSSGKIGDYKFYRTENYNEAKNLLLNGWSENLSNVKKQVTKSNFVSSGNKNIPRNSIVGYIPNVPNAILGLPESMIDLKKIQNKTKTIEILYANCGLANVSTEDYIKAGTVILNIINKLELSGIRTQLKISAKFSEGDKERTICFIKLKDYREHLDLLKLCFPIAHPSFQRRFGFKWLETQPKLADNCYAYGYGRTIDLRNYYTRAEMCKLIEKPNSILISYYDVENLKFDEKAVFEKFFEK